MHSTLATQRERHQRRLSKPALKEPAERHGRTSLQKFTVAVAPTVETLPQVRRVRYQLVEGRADCLKQRHSFS